MLDQVRKPGCEERKQGQSVVVDGAVVAGHSSSHCSHSWCWDGQPGPARKPGCEERYGRAHKCGRLWQFKDGIAQGLDLDLQLIVIKRALFPAVEFSRY